MPRARPSKPQWTPGSVRALREHLGLTQADMAHEMGIRQQTVSDWECGAYKPRGASATLLTLLAERAKTPYRTGGQAKGETR